jgi:hypothetical protein
MFLRTSIFLLLCVGTLAAYCLVDVYQETGEQLLVKNDFSDGIQGWQADTAFTADQEK